MALFDSRMFYFEGDAWFAGGDFLFRYVNINMLNLGYFCLSNNEERLLEHRLKLISTDYLADIIILNDDGVIRAANRRKIDTETINHPRFEFFE